MNWDVFNLPFGSKYIRLIKKSVPSPDRRGFFFKGIFTLDKTGDTYIDMSNYKKGIVYINGNNLGRYWEIGPQKRLYCPSSFLKKGTNEIVVFDLFETESKNISGRKVLED